MSTTTQPELPENEIKESALTRGKNATVRFFKKLMLILLLLVVVSAAGFFAYANMTYSNGDRVGVLTKFEQRGLVFKTYEGELNIIGVNQYIGSPLSNETWHFSVRDEKVAQELRGLQGKEVRLSFKEKNYNFFWQGETKFFVDGVYVVKR